MKIKLYTTHYIVLQAETISEGVQLGILQEQFKVDGRNITVMGGDTMEIPLFPLEKSKKINPVKK